MKLVLSGSSAWLVPLLLLALGGFFSLWVTQPIQEGLENPIEEKKDHPKEEKKDHPKEEKKDDKKNEKKDVKEKFTMEDTVQTLTPDWRYNQLPQSMEPYHGSVTGFNCGAYSEFAIGYSPPACYRDRANPLCRRVSDNPNDYLFPDVPRYNSRMPYLEMCEDEPQILFEKDVKAMKKKSCQEQLHRPKKVPVEDLDEVIRPQYMYHRGDGTGTTLVGFGNEH